MKTIKRIDTGASSRSVKTEPGITKSIFKDMKNTRQKLTNPMLTLDGPLFGAEKRRRITGAKFDKVDIAVDQWYKQQRSMGVPIRAIELQAAAEGFAQRFGLLNFKASTSWLYRFHNRHGIAKKCEEYVSANFETVEPEDIAKQVEQEKSDEEEDENGMSVKSKDNGKLKLSNIRSHLDVLLDYVDSNPHYQKFYLALKEMQCDIIKDIQKKQTQTRITSFFKQKSASSSTTCSSMINLD